MSCNLRRLDLTLLTYQINQLYTRNAILGTICDDMAHVTGQVPASLFRLVSGKDGQSPSAIHAWLKEAQTDSPLDNIPNVTIEPGVFKVAP